jgi:hypothetical protein
MCDGDYLLLSLFSDFRDHEAYKYMSTSWDKRARFTFGEMSCESWDDLSTR